MKKLWPVLAAVLCGGMLLLSSLASAPAESEQENPYVKQLAALKAQVDTITQRKDRVIQLPEDGQVWFTSVVYTNTRTDEPSRRLAAMLASTPRLQSLIAQTRFNRWSETDSLYVYRYKSKIGGEVPALFIQDHTGKVVYKVSGANLPNDGDTLADEIATAIEQCRPRPKPSPDVRPDEQPVATIPDIRPTETPEEGGSWQKLMVAVAGLAGAGFGVYKNFKGRA
jgi:hypothetical protein